MFGLSNRVYRNPFTKLHQTEDKWKDYWKVTRFSSHGHCLLDLFRSDRCSGSELLLGAGRCVWKVT